MSGKLKHDATASISGTIYQFYVALDCCFNLVAGETLFIEKYGDITISQSKQIEVKKYEEDLTDLHENIWKTISNWLQKEFNPSDYKELILLTTQDFSKTSTLGDWNNKSNEEKQIALKSIEVNYKRRKNKNKEKESLVSTVLSNANADKLKIILGKFIILDSSPNEMKYWNTIKDTSAGHIPSTNRDDYMNSLLGFIIAPDTVSKNSWEISYDDFTARTQALSEQYSAVTKIFPQINCNILDAEISDKSKHLFVKKIEEINYNEVKDGAISDYIRTNQIILEELKNYSASKEVYENYENNLNDFYAPKYRNAKRNKSADTERDSQNFYDEITGSPAQAFLNFNDTPPFFRNGTLHNMADDENQDIKWKITPRDENE